MWPRTDWEMADAEIRQRVQSGWLSKEEGHRLKTLLQMGETAERTGKESLAALRYESKFCSIMFWMICRKIAVEWPLKELFVPFNLAKDT